MVKTNKSILVPSKGDVAKGLKKGLENEKSFIKPARIVTSSSVSQKSVDAAEVEAVLSLCKHATAYFSKQENMKTALKEVSKDTGKAAAKGAVIGGIAEGVKSSLMESSNNFAQSVAGGAFPVIAATVAFEIGKSMIKLLNGEISTTECFEEIKGKSISLIGSSIGASLGSAIGTSVGVPILGGIIGSMIGNVVATFTYQVICDVATINSQMEFAHENRIRIERECAMLKTQIEENRRHIKKLAEEYNSAYSQVFNLSLKLMEESVFADNIDEFIFAHNMIIQQCGGNIEFRNMQEFNNLMKNKEPLKF